MRRRPLVSLLACFFVFAGLVTLAKAADPPESGTSRDPPKNVVSPPPTATDPGVVVTTIQASSTSNPNPISTSSLTTTPTTSNNTTKSSQSCSEGPSCPKCPPCEEKNLTCIKGVLPYCGGCIPYRCGTDPLATLTPNAGDNSNNSNNGMIGSLIGGMVGVIVLAFGTYVGFRFYKRKKAGLPFFGVDKSDESWDGMDVGSGLNVSHQSAVIPIRYFPGSNTSSIVVTSPNGLQSSLTPPQPTFARGADRTSVRSENPFDDLEDEDAVEVKRAVAVVTKPLRSLERGAGPNPSNSQTNINTLSSISSDRQVSIIPDQTSEYMNPTYSMIVDSLSPEAPSGDRDSMASSVVISSGVAKLASTSTMTVPNAGLGGVNPAAPPLPTAKPTLVRVDTLSRNNSTSSRRQPAANATPGSTPMTSTTSLAYTSVPSTPSRFNPTGSQPDLPNLIIQNPSSSNLSLSEESPFSDRHSVSEFADEDEFSRPSVSSTPAQSRPETQLLAPRNFADRQRFPTDSMASNSTSLSGSDGEITIFWNADDPRRSAAESDASSSMGPRDTMATERIISFAETESSRERDTRVISFAESDSSRARDTIATDDHGRVISLFGEEDDDTR